MFGLRMLGRRPIDDNFVVRRDRNPNMNFKARPMTMLVAWRDDRHAATRDVLVVSFQLLYLVQNSATRSVRRFCALECNLWGYLHLNSFPCFVHNGLRPCDETSSRSFAQRQAGSRCRGRCQDLNVSRLSGIARPCFCFTLKSHHAPAARKTCRRHASVVVHTRGIQRIDGRTSGTIAETAVIAVYQKRALVDGSGCAGNRLAGMRLSHLSLHNLTQHPGDGKTGEKQETGVPASLPEIHRNRRYHFELSKIRGDMKFVRIQCARHDSVPDS